jgi:tetratricopeptide (TPR) repeat protein
MPYTFSLPLRRWSIAIALAVAGWAFVPLTVWAQLSPVLRDQFLSDPELTEPRDPLLPDLPIVRPLSPLEKTALAAELDILAATAEQLYFEGQLEAAFQTWMREVRLRRILGYEAEIEAIQRVGLRAWENSRADETQLLTLRLREIQTALLDATPLDIELLESVAATFEVLRDVDSAISVYETLIVRAAQTGDQAERRRLLENLASLQETWFRFDAAADSYRSLLTSLSSEVSPRQEVPYLKGLIRNHEDAGEWQTAIDYQRRLVRTYEQTQQPTLIPPVTLAIARNYRTLENLPQAQTFYSATYSIALAQRQTDVASEALQDLADIYRDQGKAADVLYLYQQRLAVERLSYNGYGLMQTFGQIGEFYEAEGDPDAAINAYKEALILAEHLNYRDAYFKLRLQKLLFEQGRLAVTPLERHQASRVGVLQDPDLWQGNQAGR